MKQIGSSLAAAACIALALGACGELRWDESRVELLWAERQVVFALSPVRGRVDAYAIRGGVSWLGGVALPGGECFHSQELDPAGGRLWLWSDRGGVLIDARRLAAVARWQGGVEAAPLPPVGATVIARVGPAPSVCPGSRLAVAEAAAATATPR